MAFEIRTTSAAAATLSEEEYVYLPGAPGTFPPGDLLPLAPRRRFLESPPVAILLDMDGTLTSTEPIFLLAMEHTFAAVAHEGWTGLDPDTDHPALIGLSTADNLRYLAERYGHHVSPERFEMALRNTCARLATHAPHAPLRVNAQQLLGAATFDSLAATQTGMPLPLECLANESFRHAAARLVFDHAYHTLLHEAAENSTSRARLEPLPDVGLFLALIKGLLGAEAAALRFTISDAGRGEAAVADSLSRLGVCFKRSRPLIGLVTSSSHREADLVLPRLFTLLRKEVCHWPLPSALREAIKAAFASPDTFFDIIVTASDGPEMRLKPHRDLYSTALYGLGLEPDQFRHVLGVEDTEAGVIALRAAGVSVACALPLKESAGQDLRAASCVAPGGIAELLLIHHLCLANNLLTTNP